MPPPANARAVATDRAGPGQFCLEDCGEGPVIGIALVLSAVFIPTAFIPGITGRLYQQFAVTYVRVSGGLIRKSAVALVLLAAFGVAGFFFSSKLPTSFVPDEDQGYLFLNVQLPNAASLQRTDQVTAKIEDIVAQTPGVEHVTTLLGFSLLSYVRTSYNAFAFVTLKDWHDRKKQSEQMQAIKAHLNRELATLPEGIAFTFSPPAIPGVGTSGGFTFILEDRAGVSVDFLADNVNKFIDRKSVV